MTLTKPFRRTCRQFVDGDYALGGRWQYILHPRYAESPAQYIRAFLLLQEDLKRLFQYVEPSDANLNTFSFRIHELLLRTCVEVEANGLVYVASGLMGKDKLYPTEECRILLTLL